MRITSAVVIVAAAALFAGKEARAENRPTLLSDGFYVGTRIEPGFALMLAWDLDVYPWADRSVSFGPGVAVSALSTDVPIGRRQDVMVAVDVLRAKIGLNHPGGLFRPFLMLGGGFAWTRFTREVTTAPFDEVFTGYGAVGMGADIWGTGRFGVTALSETRIRVAGSDRMPTAWFEFSVAARVGF